MYLSKLKIWNFRKFGSNSNDIENRPADFEIDFNSGLNVLVGANDAGKTAIIDAIKSVLDTHSGEWRYRITEDDFYGNSEKLKIECLFEEMTDNEAKNFIEWLNFDDEIREGNGTQLRVFLISDKKGKFNKPHTIIKAGFDSEGYDMSYEAREYLKTVYLKPLRDVESEFIPRKNSRISQILMGDNAFKKELLKDNGKDHDLTKAFAEFNKVVEKYFRGIESEIVIDGGSPLNVDNKGGLIGKKIDERLENFFTKSDTKESKFTVTRETLKDLLENIELGFKEGKKHGLGSLNRLFIAAELLHLNKDDWTGIRLGLIEEIEAHLHPQAQLKVIESLQKDENKGVQLILTTHSPNLTSKVKLKNLILISKILGDNKYAAFPLKKGRTRLENKNIKKLEKFLDVTKSNLFFANGIILVEGWAEELIIPELAKLIGYDLVEYGVSVINVAGINFEEYAKVFQTNYDTAIDIPVSILTDDDIHDDMGTEKKTHEEKKQEQESKNNKIKELEDQSVKVCVGENWTLEWVLYNSVFQEHFKKVIREVHSGTPKFQDDDGADFSEKLKEKLKNKSLDKTEIAYRFADLLRETNYCLEHGNCSSCIPIDNIKNDSNLKYIVDGIKHACGYLNDEEHEEQ